jgi:hypothetical protein
MRSETVGEDSMTDCDTCGCPVNPTGYLGGGIICDDCAQAKRDGDIVTVRERAAKYGGGDNWTGDAADVMYSFNRDKWGDDD